MEKFLQIPPRDGHPYLVKYAKEIYTKTEEIHHKLYQHLSIIDKQAQERYDVIVEQMKKAQGITEQLKSENSFLWFQKMDGICDAAMEIVNTKIIFA